MQTSELLNCMVLRLVPNWLKLWCYITILRIFFFPFLHEHLVNPQITEFGRSQRDKLASIPSFSWQILASIFSSLLRTYHPLLYYFMGNPYLLASVVLFKVEWESTSVLYPLDKSIFLCQMDTIVFDGYYSNLHSARFQNTLSAWQNQ